jgi:hypothetical protein
VVQTRAHRRGPDDACLYERALANKAANSVDDSGDPAAPVIHSAAATVVDSSNCADAPNISGNSALRAFAADSSFSCSEAVSHAERASLAVFDGGRDLVAGHPVAVVKCYAASSQ